MARKKAAKTSDGKRAERISETAAVLAEWAARALVVAEELRIKSEPVERLALTNAERAALAMVPTIAPNLKKKLGNKEASLTVADAASLVLALAEGLMDAEKEQQATMLMIVRRLLIALGEWIGGLAQVDEPKKPTRATKSRLFQFKITLLESKPPIWRRIQVLDCTLDKLNEHIQTAMGWTNSHLHQFEIDGERYGDPELLDDDFDGFECIDSTITKISRILPKGGKEFSFGYEYDFGDGWEHEVLFEGSPALDPKAKYPLCLEGARACPPEDVGGVRGYAEYLEAMADCKHERHQEFMEWRGSFDAEAFDPAAATKEMQKGLPDWRELEREEGF